MCRWLEVDKASGKYKNRLTLGRFCCCFPAALLVICIGFACGLMAFYLPDELQYADNGGLYRRIAKQTGQQDRYGRVEDLNCKGLLTNSTMYEYYSETSRQLMFKCEDNTCVPAYARCSGYYECADKSDEKDCDKFCEKAVGYELRFKCDKPYNRSYPVGVVHPDVGPVDPTCFLYKYKCNGRVECPADLSSSNDESDCPDDSIQQGSSGPRCSLSNRFLCGDGFMCTFGRCNHIVDCPVDGSDEMDCTDE